MINNPSLKDFNNHLKTIRAVICSSRPLPNILKYRDDRWDLSTIRKTRLLETHMKSSANLYESSGSQFLRTTTGIQSGPDAFDESRFVMTLLTILGVICSFRLVLEGKASEEVLESSRLDFLENFLANNFY